MVVNLVNFTSWGFSNFPLLQNIEEIVDSIGQYDIRLGLVEFKDHPPEDRTFVTRAHDFTRCKKTMRRWLCDARAGGGGDYPEAVADAFRAALRELTWRVDATKICVLITDSIPHGLSPKDDCRYKDGRYRLQNLFY